MVRVPKADVQCLVRLDYDMRLRRDKPFPYHEALIRNREITCNWCGKPVFETGLARTVDGIARGIWAVEHIIEEIPW